ncbi:MAG TPA: bifunctional DNA-formamidopyrimidine glycosylase/DNA-(apurinic or apyrimidinic site) lyase [Casimicrobiaceae bacterium]|nr:bifunctional DNA-formamidopyrimidine glycosylase/DNA-(apurinic or apyrimidinic site) lyase [Kofleriaceae bacterium]
MPELPEVETTRRGIAPHLHGRVVSRVIIYDHRLRWPVPDDLDRRMRGATIVRVDRRSKYLLLHTGPAALIVHLGMTGSLRIWRDPPPRGLHDHVDIRFDDGTVLRYRDPRRFGAMLWVPVPVERHPLLASLGPEPFDAAFDARYLWRTTRGRRAAIKLVLMDNRVVTGVGNIYANEALFRARIRPTVPAGRVSRARLEGLVASVREVLVEAIAKGGTTLRDYVDSDGREGYFQLDHFVYGRDGLPCRVCGVPVRVVRLGQRSSFYCPRCQSR